jgi:hypothetical protein
MPVRIEEALNTPWGTHYGAGKREAVMRLADKVTIISGAASGMGAATARMFALRHEIRHSGDGR